MWSPFDSGTHKSEKSTTVSKVCARVRTVPLLFYSLMRILLIFSESEYARPST